MPGNGTLYITLEYKNLCCKFKFRFKCKCNVKRTTKIVCPSPYHQVKVSLNRAKSSYMNYMENHFISFLDLSIHKYSLVQTEIQVLFYYFFWFGVFFLVILFSFPTCKGFTIEWNEIRILFFVEFIFILCLFFIHTEWG